jgi:hypothetical protein
MPDNQKTNALIKLLRELNVHSLYPCASVAKWLGECGFVVEVSEDGETLHVFDTPIHSIKGDWGKGIYPPHVLNAAICFFGLDNQISSDLTGRGFAYSDLLGQLESFIGEGDR